MAQTVIWRYSAVDVRNGNLYLILDIWNNRTPTDPSDLREDITFVGAAKHKQRIVTDDAGRVLRSNGTWVLPWTIDNSGDWQAQMPDDPVYMDAFNAVKMELDSVIGTHVLRLLLAGQAGDQTDKNVATGGEDPDGWVDLLSPLIGTTGSVTA